LDVLVKDRGGKGELDEADADGRGTSIVSLGGAVEAAKKAVMSLVGLSHGTLSSIRRAPHPLALGRRPFGQWVSRQVRAAYATGLHDNLLGETDRTLTFTELRDLNEGAGAVLDRIVEGLCQQVTEGGPLLRAVLTPQALARLDSAVEVERVNLRSKVWALIEDGSLAVATSDLPDQVREAAAWIMEDGGQSMSREEGETLLEDAICRAASDVVMDGMRAAAGATFGGQLDPPPKHLQP
jgi:hypothetical protein